MKNKSVYFAIILVFVLSCKTKHKLVETTSEKITRNEVRSDSSSLSKADSSKVIVETKTETKQKSTIELIFDLDKNKLSGDSSLFNGKDTNGNNLLGLLINKALRNASTLKIKLEQSLEETHNNKLASQKNIKEVTKNLTNESIAATSKKESETVEKKVDTQPKFNLTLIILGVLVFIFLLLRFIWPFIKNYFKFFLL